MEEKNLKVTLAARVIPELKEGIIKEAEERGLTPSKFIETVLLNRQSIDPETVSQLEKKVKKLKKNNAKLSEELEALGNEFDELEEDVHTEKTSPVKNNLVKIDSETTEMYKDQIKLLKKEKTEIESQFSDVVEEKERLEEKILEIEKNTKSKASSVFDFSDNEKEIFSECIAKIRASIGEEYAEVSDEKIALTAIKLACKNEDSLFFLDNFSSYLPYSINEITE